METKEEFKKELKHWINLKERGVLSELGLKKLEILELVENLILKECKNIETSKEIIEQAKQIFKELKHKNYDWASFYNGFLEAKALNTQSVNQQRELIKAFQEFYQKGDYDDEYPFDENINRFLRSRALNMKKDFQIKDFCEHLNTYKGLEEIRFDFMLIDFLNKKM